MDDGIPGLREANYRLLGLQAVRHDGGVDIRRGRTRLDLPGERAADLLDMLVARSAEGTGLDLGHLRSEIDEADQPVFEKLVERLRNARLLVRGGDIGGDRRDDIFYWNHGTTAAATAANITSIDLAIFGINHVSLPLLGNLRSCGFRRLTLIDHPALRNLDFFDEDQKLRSEIAGAMSVRPRSFDEWKSRGRESDCQVACSDFGGFGLMRDWNKGCVATNTPFYPIVLEDEVAHLGPLVIPGEGPCFECLSLRREAAAVDPDRERATVAHAFFGRVMSGYLQPMARVAADIAAIELLKYFSKTLPGGAAGRLIEADLMVPSLRTRTVLKVPRCPVCATAAPGEQGTEASGEPAGTPAAAGPEG